MATINLYDTTRSLFNRNSLSKIYYNGLMVWPDRRKYIEGNYYTMLYSVNLADKRTSSNRSFYLYTYNDNSEYGLVKASWDDDITEFTVTYEPSEFCEATGETTKTYTFEEVITDSVGTVRFDFTDRRDAIIASTYNVSMTINGTKVWEEPWANTVNGISSGDVHPQVKYVGSWNSAYTEYTCTVEVDPEYVLYGRSASGLCFDGFTSDSTCVSKNQGLKFELKHRNEIFDDTKTVNVTFRESRGPVLSTMAINVMDTLDGYTIDNEYGVFELEWKYAYQELHIKPISYKEGYTSNIPYVHEYFDAGDNHDSYDIEFLIFID